MLWRLAGRAGRHLLTLTVDPDDEIPELDEANNHMEIELDVTGSLSAVPTMPRQSQVVPASEVHLAVRPGTSAQEVYGEFEVSASPAFDGPGVMRSGSVAGRQGLVLWKMPELAPGTYNWRTRVREGDEYGAWSAIMEFTAQSAAPAREILWRQDAAGAYRWADGRDVRLAEGAVSRVVDPPPLRLNADTREAAFAAEGVRGTGVLCTDGAYLYVNRFYSPTAVYIRGLIYSSGLAQDSGARGPDRITAPLRRAPFSAFRQPITATDLSMPTIDGDANWLGFRRRPGLWIACRCRTG